MSDGGWEEAGSSETDRLKGKERGVLNSVRGNRRTERDMRGLELEVERRGK